MLGPRSLFPCLLLLGLASLPVRARAEARFTDRSRLLPSGTAGGYWSNNERSPGFVSYPRWAVWAAPSLLYFVRDQLGLGAYVDYGFRKDRAVGYSIREHQLGGGLQCAYELVLTPKLGWLLLTQLGYVRRWISLEDETSAYFDGTAAGRTQQQRSPLRSQRITDNRNQLRLGLLAPLVFHLTDSIGVGLGPALHYDFYVTPRDRNDPDRHYQHVRVGVSSWLGGSF